MEKIFSLWLLSFFISHTAVQCDAQNTIQHNEKYLIVLDVQECYTKNLSTGSDLIPALSAINNLSKITDSDKIIYVRTLPKAITFSSWKFSIDTLPGVEYDKRLIVKNTKEYIKESGDAFDVTELLSYLQQQQVKDVIITGLLAEKCVYNTVIGGIKHGFNIFVYTDGIIGKNPESKNKVLKKMIEKGANYFLY